MMFRETWSLALSKGGRSVCLPSTERPSITPGEQGCSYEREHECMPNAKSFYYVQSHLVKINQFEHVEKPLLSLQVEETVLRLLDLVVAKPDAVLGQAGRRVRRVPSLLKVRLNN
jgi:hypothetical protein